jgi:hypothetical protein
VRASDNRAELAFKEREGTGKCLACRLPEETGTLARLQLERSQLRAVAIDDRHLALIRRPVERRARRNHNQAAVRPGERRGVAEAAGLTGVAPLAHDISGVNA